MRQLEHILESQLDMVEVDGLLFEQKELLPDVTPKNIKMLVDTINKLISYNNSLMEENQRFQQSLQINKLLGRA